jgi:ferric-dicitrate binding protein FerR (iron transport regulator)
VGTQFDVYRKRSGTTVTVVEGRVAVSGPAHPVTLLLPAPSDKKGQGTSMPATSNGESSPKVRPRTAQEKTGLVTPAGEVFVSAGEQVTVTDQAVAAPKRTNIAATTAWTQHRLIFDATPLADVVDEFNRYNARQIVIEDPELNDFHVSGVYSSLDPTSLMRFLRQQPEIDVIETDAGVRITRK